MKISFNKLKLNKKEETKSISINNETIEVLQYLPISEKLEIIYNVVAQAITENGIVNSMRVDALLDMEIIYHYTNISFTDKQKEDLDKTYDILESNDVFNNVIEVIPQKEYEGLYFALKETLKSYSVYQTSFANGIAQAIAQLNESGKTIEDIQNTIKDPKALNTLKEVMDKMV